MIMSAILILYSIWNHIFLNDARVNQIKDKLNNDTKILLIAGKKDAIREISHQRVFISLGFSFLSYEPSNLYRRLARKNDILRI